MESPHSCTAKLVGTVCAVAGFLIAAGKLSAQVSGGSCTVGAAAGPLSDGTVLLCNAGTWQTSNSLNFTHITASVTNNSGGAATASCASGYSLMFWGIMTDQRVPTIITNSGSVTCTASGATLTTTVSGYAGTSTTVTCQGLCVRS